ncbi:MAG: hypothetical protein OXT67_07110 [Zetaproteobacteria bacterium]|nr:hypothetical protein [Zetaproteobacteria bacterium]
MEKKYDRGRLLQASQGLYEALPLMPARRFLFQLIQEIENCWRDEKLRLALLHELVWCLGHPFGKKVLPEVVGRYITPALGKFKALEDFLAFAVPLERALDLYLHEHEYVVCAKDRTSSIHMAESAPLFVVAENIRSAFNVGSILRTSDCVGARHVYLCGYSAGPDNLRTQKAAMGADKYVSWSWHASVGDVLTRLEQMNIPILALETVEGAPPVYEFRFPRPCAILLGNERHGLGAMALQRCNQVLRIPMYGCKNSLNVATAYAVVAYEIRRQWEAVV